MTRKKKNRTETSPPDGKKTASGQSPTPPDDRNAEQKFGDSIRISAYRETVEAFVVAFVLALLFRAFIAEAFVIPTGSMAPTLMGAHKDIFCEQCSQRFQIGASKERRGPHQDETVVGGVCPNCRYLNNLDLAGNSDDVTFNGDRILVSKFAYALADPERWDVIVFKFPGNPKQNYIKRLVGLPNETLSLYRGDVYAEPNDGSAPETIVRKPADKLLSMRHHVYDTDHQSELLIKSGYPSRIQPWQENTSTPPTDSWKIERDSDGLVASVETKDDSETHWIRYFHRWPTAQQWSTASDGGTLDAVDPYSSRLVTDFYAYDCYVLVGSTRVYVDRPSNARMSGSVEFKPTYQSGGPLSQFDSMARFGDSGIADDGLHWVGDLIVESDVTVSTDCKELVLELIEAGIQYQCHLDLETGIAKLAIMDGDQQLPFSSGETVIGETEARAGDSFSVRFSNCDDQLLLWIDDELIQFDAPATFDALVFRPGDENVPQYKDGAHPLDTAPVGIAIRGGQAMINRIAIDRDKYYIATGPNTRAGINGYRPDVLAEIAGQRMSMPDVQAIMARPDLWQQYPVWNALRKVSFPLAEDQFFPMGDNSPESLDARCWAGSKLGPRLPDRFREQAYAFADASYVPRDLLVGKALLVFWPHPWNSPVPFTPNFNRFRLIR